MAVSIVRSQTAPTLGLPAEWRTILERCPDNVRERWEERAAIIEFDGDEPRPTAERRAFQCIVDDFEGVREILQAHLAKSSTRGSGLKRSIVA
jgi:hypothetical protein